MYCWGMVFHVPLVSTKPLGIVIDAPEHHSGDLGARTPPRLGLNVGARTHGRLGLRWLADHPRFFSEPGTRDDKGREGPP